MDIPEIDIHQTHAHLQAGGSLIDVREADEYAAVHIPGSQSLPLSVLAERYQHLPEGETIVLSCRSGARSARATAFLLEQGLKVVNMQGGILAWHAAGLAVTPEDAVPQ